MQADRFATAEIWLENARADLSVTSELSGRLPAVACFHAQQAAEKALKAVLVVLAGDVARTHVADELLEELRKVGGPVPDEIAEVARALDRFYMTTRYPDVLAGANPLNVFRSADAALAHDWADRVIAYAQKTIAERRKS